ncbi:MAG: sulfur carrier protein ThiS [Spirochaetia bacterium]|nr:sulfur carrier protein ThiS [Spirochaetia bacterium]
MTVNGNAVSLSSLEAPTLLALIRHFNLNPQAVAIERNGEIPPRGDWTNVVLSDTDTIELIRFVGGG